MIPQSYNLVLNHFIVRLSSSVRVRSFMAVFVLLLSQELCQCRPSDGNCSCCKECMMCLGTLWEECCDCVGKNIILLLIYDTTEEYNICSIMSV